MTAVQHNENPVYWDGDTMVIRASALGGCTRAMAALAAGFDKMEAPDSMQRRFDDGHLHEESILAEMGAKTGLTIEGHQDTVVLKIKPGLEVRGHVDGTCHDGTSKGVAEAKAFSDLMFKKYQSQGLATLEGYQYQLTVYMLGLGATFAIYGVKNKNSGLVDVMRIDATPKTKAEVVKRALEIQKVVLAARDHNPPAVEMTCDRSQFPCPVFYLHEEKPVAEVLEDEVLKGLVEAYDKAREEAKVAEETKSRLADEIKMRLATMEKDKVDIAGFHVTATYGSRKSLDDAALKRDYPGLDIKKYQVSKINANPTLTVTRSDQ